MNPRVLWAFCLLSLLMGCRNHPSPEEPDFTGGRLTLRLKASAELAIAEAPVDSMEVIISGGGMDTLFYRSAYQDTALEIRDLTAGDGRNLSANLYDEEQTLLYQCREDDFSILSGEPTFLSVQCLPEFSNLRITVPLGKNNPDSITQGSFSLTSADQTLTAAMDVIGELGFFNMEQIPGDQIYRLNTELRKEDGTLVYHHGPDSLFIPKGEALSLEILLNAVLGSLQIGLLLNDPPLVDIHARVADAAIRNPQSGDVVFSEFYPTPTSDEGGSDGEWVEIYNRTQDTLNLENCRIARTRSSGSSSTSHVLGDILLPPSGLLVLGRDSVPFRDLETALSLTNTKQSLLFLCAGETEELAVDSIAYTLEYPAIDSIAAQEGLVASLRPEQVGRPSTNANWCLTALNNTLSFVSTPGAIITQCD